MAAIGQSMGVKLVIGRAHLGSIRNGQLDGVVMDDGTTIRGDAYVFSCGPWLKKLFPALMENRMRLAFVASAFLFALLVGVTGAGPAAWCHARFPDQHAFRGSYGGWIFPLHDPRESGAHFIDMGVLAGLAEAYGAMPEAQDVFDAILALLSATSYTTRFAHDLEDDYPHVPFPASHDDFVEAAAIGARIRVLQGFSEGPAQLYRNARLEGDATGLTLDLTAKGMGLRSSRYSMLVKDGKVATLNIEAPGKFEVSDAATMLAQAKS